MMEAWYEAENSILTMRYGHKNGMASRCTVCTCIHGNSVSCGSLINRIHFASGRRFLEQVCRKTFTSRSITPRETYPCFSVPDYSDLDDLGGIPGVPIIQETRYGRIKYLELCSVSKPNKFPFCCTITICSEKLDQQ